MLLKGTSYQLNTNGAKEPGEEVWFILNGEGFRVKVWFPSWSAQSNADPCAGIMPSSVMNSLFQQRFSLASFN